MTKTHWKSTLLFLLLAACCLGFQVQHFWGSGKAAEQYPPDFPKVTRPVGPDFEKDSTRAGILYGRSWNAYYKQQYDSMKVVCGELYPLAANLLEQRFDSTLFEYWILSYFGYGQALIYMGDIEEGSQIMLEADAVERRIYPKDYIGRSMNYFGLGHMARDLFQDYDLALDYYKLGQSVAQNCLPVDDPFMVNVNYVIGSFYGQMGDYAAQDKYFDKVLASKPSMKTFVSGFKALNYQNAGDYENAIKYRLITITNSDSPLAVYYQNCELAECYLNIGDLDASRRCLRICEQLLRKHQAEIMSQNLGVSYFYAKGVYETAMKNYLEGIPWFRKSLAASEISGGGKMSSLTFVVFHKLTESLLLADSLPAAQAALSELLAREASGFEAFDFAQNPPVAAFTRQPYHLRTLELKGRFFEKMFEKTNDPMQLEYALKSYALADSLVERIRDTYRGLGSKNQLSEMAKPIFQRTIDCALRLWQRGGGEPYLQLAWQAAEKSKSVELLESLRETEARQLAGFRPEDQQHEKLQKRNLDFYEKLVFDEQAKPYPDSSRIANWNRKIFDLKASQDSLLAVFQKRYPEYHRLKYDRRLATIADVQTKLPAGNALVEYFLGDSVLFTFLIEHGQARVFKQNIDTSFHQNFAALRATVHDFDPAMPRTTPQKRVDFQKFTAASHALYQTLLAEPLAHTRARKLVVVPDDQIGYVPFAALLRQPVAASAAPDYRHLPYLVNDIAVRLEYSGTLLTRQPTRDGSAGGYLGMAPVYQGGAGNSGLAARALPDSLRFARAFSLLRGGEVPALRFNRVEIDSTQHFLKGESAAGEAATEAFFKKNAPNAGVLHLAMHALTNDVDPLYSTLLFSNPNPADSTGENDGFLHAYELYKLRLGADLAVLSACNTGAGKVVRGEGIMSLARAFRFAGCPNVMMSLWSVNDAAAKDLVVGFFQKLSGGMGKAGALQAAQQDFLKNTKSDELMHPYYWATFSMVGDDAPVSFAGSRWWIWGLACLVLGVIGVYFQYFHVRRSTTK